MASPKISQEKYGKFNVQSDSWLFNVVNQGEWSKAYNSPLGSKDSLWQPKASTGGLELWNVTAPPEFQTRTFMSSSMYSNMIDNINFSKTSNL